MLVSMATVDSDNEMSCLGLSVCGNRSLQYKELYLICLDKILDLTGEHGLKGPVHTHLGLKKCPELVSGTPDRKTLTARQF